MPDQPAPQGKRQFSLDEAYGQPGQGLPAGKRQFSINDAYGEPAEASPSAKGRAVSFADVVDALPDSMLDESEMQRQAQMKAIAGDTQAPTETMNKIQGRGAIDVAGNLFVRLPLELQRAGMDILKEHPWLSVLMPMGNPIMQYKMIETIRDNPGLANNPMELIRQSARSSADDAKKKLDAYTEWRQKDFFGLADATTGNATADEMLEFSGRLPLDIAKYAVAGEFAPALMGVEGGAGKYNAVLDDPGHPGTSDEALAEGALSGAFNFGLGKLRPFRPTTTSGALGGTMLRSILLGSASHLFDASTGIIHKPWEDPSGKGDVKTDITNVHAYFQSIFQFAAFEGAGLLTHGMKAQRIRREALDHPDGLIGSMGDVIKTIDEIAKRNPDAQLSTKDGRPGGLDRDKLTDTDKKAYNEALMKASVISDFMKSKRGRRESGKFFERELEKQTRAALAERQKAQSEQRDPEQPIQPPAEEARIGDEVDPPDADAAPESYVDRTAGTEKPAEPKSGLDPAAKPTSPMDAALGEAGNALAPSGDRLEIWNRIVDAARANDHDAMGELALDPQAKDMVDRAFREMDREGVLSEEMRSLRDKFFPDDETAQPEAANPQPEASKTETPEPVQPSIDQPKQEAPKAEPPKIAKPKAKSSSTEIAEPEAAMPVDRDAEMASTIGQRPGDSPTISYAEARDLTNLVSETARRLFGVKFGDIILYNHEGGVTPADHAALERLANAVGVPVERVVRQFSSSAGSFLLEGGHMVLNMSRLSTPGELLRTLTHETGHAIAQQVFLRHITSSPRLASRFLDEIIRASKSLRSAETALEFSRAGRLNPGQVFQYNRVGVDPHSPTASMVIGGGRSEYYRGDMTRSVIESMRAEGRTDAEIIHRIMTEPHVIPFAHEYLAEQISHWMTTNDRYVKSGIGRVYQRVAEAVKDFYRSVARSLGFREDKMVQTFVDQFSRSYAMDRKTKRDSELRRMSLEERANAAAQDAIIATEKFADMNPAEDVMKTKAAKIFGQTPEEQEAAFQRGLRMAHAINAERFSKSLEPDEVSGAAGLAMANAIRTFNPDRGASFETHLYSHLRKQIGEALKQKYEWLSGMTEAEREMALKIQRIREDMVKRGVEPTSEAVSQATGIPVPHINALIEMQQNFRAGGIESLDRPLPGADGTTLTKGDVTPSDVPTPEAQVAEAQNRALIRELFSRLDPKYSEIVSELMSNLDAYSGRGPERMEKILGMVQTKMGLPTRDAAKHAFAEMQGQLVDKMREMGLNPSKLVGFMQDDMQVRDRRKDDFGRGMDLHIANGKLIDLAKNAYNLTRNITGFEAMKRMIGSIGESGIRAELKRMYTSADERTISDLVRAYRFLEGIHETQTQRVFGKDKNDLIQDFEDRRVLGLPLRGRVGWDLGKVGSLLRTVGEPALKDLIGREARAVTRDELVRLSAESERHKYSGRFPSLTSRDVARLINEGIVGNKSRSIKLPSGHDAIMVVDGDRVHLGVVGSATEGNMGEPAMISIAMVGPDHARVDWAGTRDTKVAGQGVGLEMYKYIAQALKKMGVQYMTGDIAGDGEGIHEILNHRLGFPSTSLMHKSSGIEPSEGGHKTRAYWFAATRVEDIADGTRVPIDHQMGKALGYPWGREAESKGFVSVAQHEEGVFDREIHDRVEGIGDGHAMDIADVVNRVQFWKRDPVLESIKSMAETSMKDKDVHMDRDLAGRWVKNFSSSFTALLREGKGMGVFRLFEQENNEKMAIMHDEIAFRRQLHAFHTANEDLSRRLMDVLEKGSTEMRRVKHEDGKWRLEGRGVRYGFDTFQKMMKQRGVTDDSSIALAYKTYNEVLDHYKVMKDKLIAASEIEVQGTEEALARAIKAKRELIKDGRSNAKLDSEIARLEATAKTAREVFEKWKESLNNNAYIPLERRGKYSLTVKDSEGSSRKAANKVWVFRGDDRSDLMSQLAERVTISPELQELQKSNRLSIELSESEVMQDGGEGMNFSTLHRLASMTNVDSVALKELESALMNMKNIHSMRQRYMERQGYRGARNNLLEMFDLYLPSYASSVARSKFAKQQEAAFMEIPENHKELRSYLSSIEQTMRGSNTGLWSAVQSVKGINLMYRILGRPGLMIQDYMLRLTHFMPKMTQDFGMSTAARLTAPGNSLDRAAMSIGKNITMRNLTMDHLDKIFTPDRVARWMKNPQNAERVAEQIKRIVWDEYRNGLFLDNPATEFSEGKAGGNAFERGLNDVIQKGGIMLRYSDAWNRSQALIMASIAAIEHGVPAHWHGRLKERVDTMNKGATEAFRSNADPQWQMIREYAHDFSIRATLPSGSKLFRSKLERGQAIGGRHVGAVASLALQFKSFSINTMGNYIQEARVVYEHEISRGASKEDAMMKAASGPLLGQTANLMVGGISALPGTMVAFSIASFIGRKLTDDPNFNAFDEMMKWISKKFGVRKAKALADGMFNLVGIDLGRMFRDEMLPQIPRGGSLLEDAAHFALGPTAGLVDDFDRAVVALSEGRTWDAAQNILPVSMRRPARAITELVKGQRNIGGVREPANPADSIAYGLGVNTTDRSFVTQVATSKRDALERRSLLLKQLANDYDDRRGLTASMVKNIEAWNKSVEKDEWLKNDKSLYISGRQEIRAIKGSVRRESGQTKGQEATREVKRSYE